jgi:sRNA-binding protein
MMKLAILLGMFVLALMAGVMLYNVWHGEMDPVATTPSAVEQGRLDLHANLVQGEQREAEIEKTYWNSPEKLRVIIKSHRRRIDELDGNRAGAEIATHDKDAIARLEKRIADIEDVREAEAKTAMEKAKSEAQAKRAQALQKRTVQNQGVSSPQP